MGSPGFSGAAGISACIASNPAQSADWAGADHAHRLGVDRCLAQLSLLSSKAISRLCSLGDRDSSRKAITPRHPDALHVLWRDDAAIANQRDPRDQAPVILSARAGPRETGPKFRQ
jgi:hypothetical protein